MQLGVQQQGPALQQDAPTSSGTLLPLVLQTLQTRSTRASTNWQPYSITPARIVLTAQLAWAGWGWGGCGCPGGEAVAPDDRVSNDAAWEVVYVSPGEWRASATLTSTGY